MSIVDSAKGVAAAFPFVGPRPAILLDILMSRSSLPFVVTTHSRENK
jgi:hypothetical protein